MCRFFKINKVLQWPPEQVRANLEEVAEAGREFIASASSLGIQEKRQLEWTNYLPIDDREQEIVAAKLKEARAGARLLNIELQAALNPAGDRKVERFGWTFAPGDKVMQIKNDYDKEVYNGDIGYIVNVDPDAGEIIASFDDRYITYGFGELDMLVPAYAATIHKSQGSEYPAVVIPMLTQHYAMLQRNLLYTGVTRGKRLVVLVGQKKAIAIAVSNASGRRRWSKLAEWLSADLSKRYVSA